MLSFGMEYERAFSIAFASARFAAGSGPPSRAATISARESFEKSWPRFLSAAPFLCLIELHLLCPDIGLLPYEVEEPLVHARVVGQLRVERGDQDAALAQQHRLAVELGEHLDVSTHLRDTWRPDEDAPQRPLVAVEVEVGFEARHLAAVGVALDSPPGMIRPSSPSSCSGLRTSTGSAPSRRSIAACSRKFPCTARTPILMPKSLVAR